jgi:hypothetical protein
MCVMSTEGARRRVKPTRQGNRAERQRQVDCLFPSGCWGLERQAVVTTIAIMKEEKEARPVLL